jgi:hypothetical protein
MRHVKEIQELAFSSTTENFLEDKKNLIEQEVVSMNEELVCGGCRRPSWPWSAMPGAEIRIPAR